MKIIILTGSETRHQYFRLKVSNDERIKVLASYCEGAESSLANRVNKNAESSALERLHVEARSQAEIDFFEESINQLPDKSNPIFIKGGHINDATVVAQIEASDADLLVCYGTSLIKSSLLTSFYGRFLNVHLGLSPYYRGSGTNVWPLINGEPEMVGATFMHIDAGIDTGQIIHQIKADFFIGDSPHSIGNRLIKKMTLAYCDVIAKFHCLTKESQPTEKGRLYFERDFDSIACANLYQKFQCDLVTDFIQGKRVATPRHIVENRGLFGK